MRTFARYIAQITVLSVLFLTVLIAHADEPLNANAPIVIAKMDTPKVLLGEPAFLTLTFINQGATVIPWTNPQVMWRDPNVQIECIREEKRLRVSPKLGIGYALHGHGNDPWRLQPNEARSMQIDLSLFSGIEKSGNYLLQVRYFSNKGSFQIQEEIQRLGLENMWEGTVVSNLEELIILEPKGVDAEVFNLLKLQQLFDSTTRPSEIFGSDNAMKVLSDYPNSAYAKYCMYYLGRYKFYDSDKGLSLLRQFIKENPTHPLAENAQFDIVKNLYEKRKVSEANKESEIFRQLYPQSDLVPEIDSLKERYNRH